MQLLLEIYDKDHNITAPLVFVLIVLHINKYLT